MKKILCRSVKPLLPAYTSRDLDAELNSLVREHLRVCPECAAEAAEISHAYNTLRAAAPDTAPPSPTLAPRRRERTLWLMGHPLAGWFFLHRHITGVICAVVVVTAFILLLFTIKYPDIFKLRRIEVMIYTPAPVEFLPDPDPAPDPAPITPQEYVPAFDP